MLMDEKQFEQLYIGFKQYLIHYAISIGVCPEDAEEIADEAFVRLWKVRNKKTDLEGKALHVWLFRTVRLIRLEYAKHTPPPTDAIDDHTELVSGDSATGTVEISDLICSLEEGLDETDKKILRLMLVEDRPYEEVERRLKLKPSTLRTRLTRLKQKLQKKLKQS